MSTRTIRHEAGDTDIAFSPTRNKVASLIVAVALGVPVVSWIAQRSQKSNLAAQLDHPRDEVKANILAHKIDPHKVVIVTAQHDGYAYNQASEVVGSQNDPTEVSNIMTDQNGNNTNMSKGTVSYIPRSDIPNPPPSS